MNPTIAVREYQQRAIDQLYAWWVKHDPQDIPLLVLPTGSGKSIVIAELVRLLWDTWPEEHPRTVVLVPSKELAEQNADKLRRVLPARRSVGYYSASLGRKDQHADVIVATIGSIYKDAHLLGSIRCVIIDEAHLVNPDGTGRYRQFLSDLGKYNPLSMVGLTATPFRGDGVWLTVGDDPLFRGIACEVKIGELLTSRHLAPLVRPVDDIATRIDTDDIGIVNGDYRIDELSRRVDQFIPAAVAEALTLAADRKKWIAFTPDVATAQHLVAELRDSAITAALVCGITEKKERAQLVEQFRTGEIRCLVTVLALATGFDVPDVDCVIWCRPTRSPVLYVQGAGRGTRTAPGKTDCLWLDFSNTTERLGPIDTIRGRGKRKTIDTEAPFAVCPECGCHVRPANLLLCPECGAQLREEKEREARAASNAAILSAQLASKIIEYTVTSVSYGRHRKNGAPDSMRVDYWSGIRLVASEWVCIEHAGFARAKAEAWVSRRYSEINPPLSVGGLLELSKWALEPLAITVDESGRFPEITHYTWAENESSGIDGAADCVTQTA